LEVLLDSCMVRTTTKESRRSTNLPLIILERRNGYAEECIMADAFHHPGNSDCPENPVSIRLKGGETMPIKWSALMVNEAMDMVEEYVNQAIEPLAQAKIVANEARNIANLPQYIDQRLVRLIIDIERINCIKNSIEVVRKDLPGGAVETERKVESHGRQPVLIS